MHAGSGPHRGLIDLQEHPMGESRRPSAAAGEGKPDQHVIACVGIGAARGEGLFSVAGDRLIVRVGDAQ
jgi:hypothetical protein